MHALCRRIGDEMIAFGRRWRDHPVESAPLEPSAQPVLRAHEYEQPLRRVSVGPASVHAHLAALRVQLHGLLEVRVWFPLRVSFAGFARRHAVESCRYLGALAFPGAEFSF